MINRDGRTPFQHLADRLSSGNGEDHSGQHTESDTHDRNEAEQDGVFSVEHPGNDPRLARTQPGRLFGQLENVAHHEFAGVVSRDVFPAPIVFG